MKTRLTLSLMALCGLFLLAGCATSHRAQAAQTLLVAGESVNAAMNVYGELYRSPNNGGLSAEDISEVRKLHADFQSLYNQAVVAVEFDLSELTPTELAAVVSDLILTIDRISK